MNPFRQTFVLSLVLVMIMVCGVTTQATQSANAMVTSSTAKPIKSTPAATTTTSHQSTAMPSKTTVQSTEKLTYECYSNQTIRLVGSDLVKSSKSLIITSGNSSSHVDCTGRKENGGGFLIEGKDCFNILLRGDLTSESNSNIIGGKNFTEFTFECNGLPKNGTFKTVTVKIASQIESGATPRPAISLQPQFPSLDLQCTVTDNNNKTQVSFTNGDEEVLHIKGPDAYYMYLQECIAFNGTSAKSSNKNHTLYKDFKPLDLAIIDTAIDGLKGEITIKVYAFHFVGSSDVTYQCAILICPDTTCRQQASGRKRRATSVRSEQVEASVKVHDKYDLTGNTVSSAERTETALFLLVASMTLLTSFF